MKRGFLRKMISWCTMVCVAVVSVLFASCGSKNGGIEYLAVQMDEGDDWSIIDADGNVVVKEGFDEDEPVSRVYDDGVFWVYSDLKYRLYSIDSPKKPLGNGEFSNVTDFNEGLAFTSNDGEEIKMINTKGEVVKSLPKSIRGVWGFYDGLSVYRDEKGMHGYLDKDCNVVIKATYEQAGPFVDGLALVQKTYGSDFLIINKKGEVKGKINAEKYDVLASQVVGGVIVCRDKSNEKVVLLNTDSEVVLTIPEKCLYAFRVDDYCVVYNDDYEYGVYNMDGERVFRTGKYSSIVYLGKDQFLVGKGDDCARIVDKDDNVIEEFDFERINYYSNVYAGAEMNVSILGDKNIVVRDGDTWILVDREGKPVKGAEFYRASCFVMPNGVFYYDTSEEDVLYSEEGDYGDYNAEGI